VIMRHPVSIIVPVYKAESYLDRLLNSILNQSFTDFELILVDDGSPDQSGNICDSYAKSDDRIRVIHKKNQGVSAARQSGLDETTGNYVIFADPDDWVEKNWIEELYLRAKETDADIVVCDFFKEYREESIYKSEKTNSTNNEDIIKDLLNEKIWGASWNKLFKKSCFEKYQIAFIPEMNLWEDLMVFTKFLQHGAKLSHIEKPLYHYDCFTNSQSIVRKANLNHIQSQKLYIDYIDSIYGNDPSFANSIFHCKTMIKRRIFYFGFRYNSLLKTTCSEINEQFIKEFGHWNGNVLHFSIALCLKGYPIIGHLFNYFMINIYSPLISFITK